VVTEAEELQEFREVLTAALLSPAGDLCKRCGHRRDGHSSWWMGTPEDDYCEWNDKTGECECSGFQESTA